MEFEEKNAEEACKIHNHEKRAINTNNGELEVVDAASA